MPIEISTFSGDFFGAGGGKGRRKKTPDQMNDNSTPSARPVKSQWNCRSVKGMVRLRAIRDSYCDSDYYFVAGKIMTEPIISVSGMRGIVGETLTPEVAIRYVAAFAAMRRRAISLSAATAAPRAGCSRWRSTPACKP